MFCLSSSALGSESSAGQLELGLHVCVCVSTPASVPTSTSCVPLKTRLYKLLRGSGSESEHERTGDDDRKVVSLQRTSHKSCVSPASSFTAEKERICNIAVGKVCAGKLSFLQGIGGPWWPPTEVTCGQVCFPRLQVSLSDSPLPPPGRVLPPGVGYLLAPVHVGAPQRGSAQQGWTVPL